MHPTKELIQKSAREKENQVGVTLQKRSKENVAREKEYSMGSHAEEWSEN